MKNAKKISMKLISKILVFVMIFSLLPVMAVSAEEYTYDENGFAIVDGVVVDYKGPGGDVVIPSGVTEIAEHAMDSVECTSVTLPTGLKKINKYAIKIAAGGYINLPSDWEGGCSAEKYAFSTPYGDEYGCSLVVPSDIKTIDSSFNITSKIIVTGNTDGSYKNASWYNKVRGNSCILPVFEESEFDENGFVIKDGVLLAYDGPGGDLVIPDNVTEVAQYVFIGMDQFDSVTIPDNVTSIGDGCFAKLRGRCKKITIGDGITELTYQSFGYANACEEITLGKNIEKIDKYALWGCSAEVVTIPESVKTIGENALYFLNNVKKLDFSHVEYLGESVFYSDSLMPFDVIDLSNIKEMEQGALGYLTADKVILGSEITEINDRAMPEVKEELVWPKNGKLRTIKKNAFYNVEILENSPLPDYIEVIEDYAFQYGKCETVRLPLNLNKLGASSLQVKTEGNIVIPSGWPGTATINKDAFVASHGTKASGFSLVIPTDIKGIEDDLINATGVEKIVIQILPGETNYINTEWYKKLVDSEKEISVETVSGSRISFSRIKGTSEYNVRFQMERISSDEENNLDVEIDIPEGFSYIEGSFVGSDGKIVSTSSEKIVISLPANKYSDINLKLSQDKLFTENIFTKINCKISDQVSVSSGTTPLYVSFELEPQINSVKVGCKANPKEEINIFVNSKENKAKCDSYGKTINYLSVDSPNVDVYLNVCGLETEHKQVEVKIVDISNIKVSSLQVTHKEYGAVKEITTDISEPGEIITCYPVNIFTFEMEGKGFDEFEGNMNLVCGGYTLPVKKVDGKYVAQGYINTPDTSIQIKCGNDVIFSTSVNWIIDPSGYVYEVSPDNRIEGATATIYYSEYETGKDAVKWDAENYGQKNDLVTGEDGYFAWDVPEGYYRVVVDKKGYLSAKSDWLPVPPIQLDVNIAIEDRRAAKVEYVVMEEDHMNIYFDKYMNEYYSLLANNYTISDGTNEISISGVTAIESATYKKSNYVKSVRLNFETPLSGEQLNKIYSLKCADYYFYTYKGTTSLLPKINGIKVDKEVTEIKTDKGTAVRLGNNIEITATLLPLEAAAGKKVKASVSDETVAKILSVSDVDANGNVKIVLEGEKYGQTDIKIELEEGMATATMPVVVAIDSSVKKLVQTELGIASLPVEKDKYGKVVPEDGETASEEEKKEDEEIVSPAENLKVGTVITVGKAKYVVGKNNTVTYKAATSKKVASVNIPNTVKIKGKTYKVTAISAHAFKNNKKLKKVTIGKNVKAIGKSAFYGCKSLKTIIIKTTKLTSKSVGKNAFAKINSKAKVKVSKAKLKSYKKLLKSKGIKGKKQKVTK